MMGIVLLALAMFASGVSPVQQERYIMGTTCRITAYPQQSGSEAAISAGFDELKRIDGALSNWKEDSELMRLNRAAGAPGVPRPAVHVSDELFERLKVTLALARETEGRFDPTVGPLVRAYGFLPKCSHDCSIETARERTGWQKVQLHESDHTVSFTVPGMELDLGGIAKGYASGRAMQALTNLGLRAGFVSLGTSSISAIGAPPDAPGWRVQIRDPRDGETAAAELWLQSGESLATSGTYEHRRGKLSHIIDPETGKPLSGKLSVTVVSRDPEIADALTKPFMLLGSLSGAASRRVLAAHPDTSVILIKRAGKRLAIETAGAQPDRFRVLHAAKTN